MVRRCRSAGWQNLLNAAKNPCWCKSKGLVKTGSHWYPSAVAGPVQGWTVPMTGLQRLMMAAAGLAILLVLGLAARLTPDPQGFGTHRQLGLPECSFRQLTGVPCPQCGMTTSLCHLVRGRPAAALRANPGGVLLGGLLVVLAPWCLLVSLQGRWLITQDPQFWLLHGGLLFLTVTCLLWIVRFF